jgi:hypothetical protein
MTTPGGRRELQPIEMCRLTLARQFWILKLSLKTD